LAFDIFTDLLGFLVIQKEQVVLNLGAASTATVVSRLEAAATGSFIKWNVGIPDKQIRLYPNVAKAGGLQS